MRGGSMLVIVAAATAAAWLPGDGAAQDGQAVFRRQCSACHAPGQNKIGPSLAGVAGRKAASVAGFAYSEPMKKANLTWTDDSLEKYLADPKAVVPGGKMAFAGLKNPADLKAVVDYLKTLK
jgi:cytochrome c